MRQAIEEGFILDVLANYITYATYYRLANSRPPRTRRCPRARPRRAGPVRVAAPDGLRAEGRDHRRALPAAHRKKIGGHAKAMVVTRSRLHAVRYKQAIDAYIAEKGYEHRAGPDRRSRARSPATVVDPNDPT